MDIVKKNLISIIAGVVAIAAIAVAFTMVSSKRAELQTKLTSSAGTFTTLHGLLTKDRTLPTVDPDHPTAEKLTKFPSNKIIEQGEQITKKVEAESTAMRDAAVKMNIHTPIVPGSLPNPQNFAAAAGFRNAYQLYFPAPPQSMLNSQFAKDLKAGMPPTAEEITAAQNDLANKIRAKELYFLPTGQPGNEPQVTAKIQDQAKKLPEQMRQKVADTSKVYIQPNTFEPYTAILQAQGAPAPLDIYLAQLQLWLQHDVVDAVNEANKDAKNVQDAVVKQLTKVTVYPYFIKGSANGADPDAALPKEIAYSPTGRVCNGLYDVFHFEMDADVDAARLPQFLKALGTDRFITPLWIDIKPVDNATQLAQGHVYGNRPVVSVHMRCENLYLRKWNALLMPKVVRDGLGIPDAPAPGTEQQPGAAPAAQPAQPAASAQ